MKDIEKTFKLKSYADSCFFVFEEYHNLIDVFKRQKTNELTSHQKEYNIRIDLKLEKILSFESLYSMSQDKLQMLQQYLNEHLVKNFIQSSCSLFAFLILFAKKSDRELQFCIDYQALNTITIQNQYSILLIQKTLDQFSKTQFFTKFDIIHVFNQIHICEDNEKYTVFQTQ